MSVALYAAETWTLTQADRSKLEAFEMWIWRRMEKISWVDKKTNQEILYTIENIEKYLAQYGAIHINGWVMCWKTSEN